MAGPVAVSVARVSPVGSTDVGPCAIWVGGQGMSKGEGGTIRCF